MEHKIYREQATLVIDLRGEGEWQGAVLAVFEACRVGLCACPLARELSLDSLRVEARSGALRLTLEAPPEAPIDLGVMDRCLRQRLKRLP